ncbi:MAG TPA: hypothetical protein VGF17_09380, partial [Phytomonospora sp.]
EAAQLLREGATELGIDPPARPAGEVRAPIRYNAEPRIPDEALDLLPPDLRQQAIQHEAFLGHRGVEDLIIPSDPTLPGADPMPPRKPHLSELRTGAIPATKGEDGRLAVLGNTVQPPRPGALEIIGANPDLVAALGLGLKQGAAEAARERPMLDPELAEAVLTRHSRRSPLEYNPLNPPPSQISPEAAAVLAELEPDEDETPEHVWTCPKHGPQHGPTCMSCARGQEDGGQ